MRGWRLAFWDAGLLHCFSPRTNLEYALYPATLQEEEEGPASPWYATSTDTDLDSLLGSIPEEGESRLQSGAQSPQQLS
jgi:hypothetical protein